MTNGGEELMIYDVAVIGAGVIGSMIARELSRYCVKTCLIEKEADVARGTSMAKQRDNSRRV